MYHYWGFGLTIKSEIELPELLPVDFDGAIDLLIRVGETPDSLEGAAVVAKVGVWISTTEYLLRIDGVAAYHAKNGNEIVVCPAPGAGKETIRLFMLSNAFAAIAYQRNLLPLHASAILNNGELTLFAGNSGAGKSTIAVSLGQAGYQVFSDDVCVIDPQPVDGQILASACYPAIRLWDESISKLGIQKNEGLQLRPHLEKYAYHFHRHFRTEKHPIARIFILETSGMVTNVQLETLQSPIIIFSELQKHAYRKVQMNAMQKRPLVFTTFSQLATQCEVIRVTRPKKTDSLEELRLAILPYLDRPADAGISSVSFLQKQISV